VEMIEEENEHQCSFFCDSCGDNTDKKVLYPIFEYNSFLTTLKKEDVYDDEKMKLKFQDYKTKQEYHCCEYTVKEYDLYDYIIVYDIETYRSKYGILKAYMIAWKILCQQCFYTKNHEPCVHISEIKYEMGDVCFVDFLKYIFNTKYLKKKKKNSDRTQWWSF
jgi:hypothetical protein